MSVQTEGKTKILNLLFEGCEIFEVETKNDITGGDGAKHDIIKGKAELSTRTTCNVFDYLRTRKVPMSYVGRDGPTTFLTRFCDMIPVEVVVRGIADGSYCKRHPEMKPGTVFNELVVEYYLKTKNRSFEGQALPCDDPLMKFDVKTLTWLLYDPKVADKNEARIGEVSSFSEKRSLELLSQLNECREIAIKVFSLLERAWQFEDGKLVDIKLEFGITKDGRIVLADVIDCDSWRVKWRGLQLSKQGYRDGDDLERVLGVYRIAAAITNRFPRF
jgi:phosphoribosylaminoimidazole-succinocarboxamide synthase